MTGLCKAWNGETVPTLYTGPLEDADAAGVSHITHRCGDGCMYVITAIRL